MCLAEIFLDHNTSRGRLPRSDPSIFCIATGSLEDVLGQVASTLSTMTETEKELSQDITGKHRCHCCSLLTLDIHPSVNQRKSSVSTGHFINACREGEEYPMVYVIPLRICSTTRCQFVVVMGHGWVSCAWWTYLEKIIDNLRLSQYVPDSLIVFLPSPYLNGVIVPLCR